MAADVIALPASVVFTGPEASELVVAFRVSDDMSDVVVRVDETVDEVVVRVEAAWNGPSDASAGWFPYLVPASRAVGLDGPVGARPVRAWQSAGFC